MLSAVDLGYVLPDSRTLFAGVEFSLSPGEALVVEGPSGTGKSTMLAILAGLLAPTSGTVRHTAAPGAPFALVLQGLNTLTARSVLDNAALLASLDGMGSQHVRKRSLATLDALGLTRTAPLRAGRLSGGELQRLAVARALTSTRPIVLADEPTSQLDRVNASAVMANLIAAAGEGRVVLIVTHDHDALPAGVPVRRLTAAGLLPACPVGS